MGGGIFTTAGGTVKLVGDLVGGNGQGDDFSVEWVAANLDADLADKLAAAAAGAGGLTYGKTKRRGVDPGKCPCATCMVIRVRINHTEKLPATCQGGKPRFST